MIVCWGVMQSWGEKYYAKSSSRDSDSSESPSSSAQGKASPSWHCGFWTSCSRCSWRRLRLRLRWCAFDPRWTVQRHTKWILIISIRDELFNGTPSDHQSQQEISSQFSCLCIQQRNHENYDCQQKFLCGIPDFSQQLAVSTFCWVYHTSSSHVLSVSWGLCADCKRRKFRREFSFVAFVQLKKVWNLFPYQIFFRLACRPFGRLFLFLLFFGHFESTKLNSIRKVLDGKVRMFSPTKNSSFTVWPFSYEIATKPVLWIELGGMPKWLPLDFGYHDVMYTATIDNGRCSSCRWTAHVNETGTLMLFDKSMISHDLRAPKVMNNKNIQVHQLQNFYVMRNASQHCSTASAAVLISSRSCPLTHTHTHTHTHVHTCASYLHKVLNNTHAHTPLHSWSPCSTRPSQISQTWRLHVSSLLDKTLNGGCVGRLPCAKTRSWVPSLTNIYQTQSDPDIKPPR